MLVSRTDRLIARTTRVTRHRPSPPRQGRFSSVTNLLTWAAPERGDGAITHYRIRIGSDTAEPVYQVPVGQTALQLSTGITLVFISSYNQINDRESALLPVAVDPTAGEPGEPGEPGPPGLPEAPPPEVASVGGVTVGGRIRGRDTVALFGGAINYPTTDPNYSRLKYVEVEWEGPNGERYLLARFDKPVPPATAINFVNLWDEHILLRKVTITGSALRFVAIGEGGMAGTSPVIVPVILPALEVLSISGVELVAQRWQTDDTRQVHSVVQLTVNGTPGIPFYATIWTKQVGGARGPKRIWHVWWEINGTTTITLGAQGSNTELYTPLVDEVWTAIAEVGTIDSNTVPTTAAVEGPITGSGTGGQVVAIQPPATGLITSIEVAPPGDLPFPYDLLEDNGLNHYWSIAYVIVNTEAAYDAINVFTVILTAQDLGADGNPIGPEHIYGTPLPLKGELNFGKLDGPYGVEADPPRTGPIAGVRLRAYLGNRTNSTTAAWQDPEAATLQATRDVTVAEGAQLPPGFVESQPSPPIHITDYKVEEKQDGFFEVQVFWEPDATATAENFKGVHAYLEDPDLSTAGRTPLDGRIKLNGTANLSGQWKPIGQGDFFDSPITLKIQGKPAARPIRVYGVAFGNTSNGVLKRANESGATPNIQIPIPASTSIYISGMEHAWLITDPAVDILEDFDNPSGPKATFVFSFVPPDPTIPLPRGLKPLASVRIIYERDSGEQLQGPLLDVNRPDTWRSEPYPVGSTIHYKVWFCSVDIEGSVNEIVSGVTPMVEVTVTYPPAGQASAPDVTALTLSNYRHEAQPDGTVYARIDAQWTIPAGPRYSGVFLYRMGVTPPRLLATAVTPVVKTTLEVIDWPKAAEAWTIAAIAFDPDHKPSIDPATPIASIPARVPRATWNIGPPAPGGTGQEYAPVGGVGSVTITTEQQLNSDGVVMMRHKISGWTNSTDNTFGGMSIGRVRQGTLHDSDSGTGGPKYWDAAKNDTSILTDWEPAPSARTWSFYFVSRDMTGRRNSILPGTTPKVDHAFTPNQGNVIPGRLDPKWWNEDEFDWPAGQPFTADTFLAKKIFVGSILRVGGGLASGAAGDAQFKGFQNGQIAVYNSSNVIRGWIGEQSSQATPDNTAPHTVYGAWFPELYLGGDGPPTAPIYSTQAGVVIVGGWDVAGSRYPYISIRNKTGVEVGRMGARVGQGQVGAESTIEGAWFREFAYGGQSFADWRMLAKTDATNPLGSTVEMRNIGKFTIDYMQNYPTPSNPNNAIHLEFGYDTFIIEGTTGGSNYKFPGFSLMRAGTKHGINVIHRGIVIWGPESVSTPYRKAALIQYNGDANGGDGGQFWGELNLYDSVNRANVRLASGGGSPLTSSYFELYDDSANLNFRVNQVGNVTIRGSLSGTTASFTGALQAVGLNALTGAIIGTNFNVTNGAITCVSLNCSQAGGGDVTAKNIWITGQGRASIANNGDVWAVNLYITAFPGAPAITSAGVYNGASVNMAGDISTSAGKFVCQGGNGVTLTFLTGDGRTATVKGGIITNVA